MKTRTDSYATQGAIPQRGPALVAVVAPWCSRCASLLPRLEDVARRWEDDVELVVIDLSRNRRAAADLSIRAIPTIVGVRDGSERFRHAGVRTQDELEALFGSLANEPVAPKTIGATDGLVRVGAGAALVMAGALAGPAWPLVAVGIGLTGYGMTAWMSRTE